MQKSQARQLALQLLYGKLSGGNIEYNDDGDAVCDDDGGVVYSDESIRMVLEEMPEDVRVETLSRTDRRFIFGLLNGIHPRLQEYKDIIAKYLASDWTVERLSRIDLCILLLAIEELCHHNTSDAIVISEALKMAEQYSDPKSKPFINALLGNIARNKNAGQTES